MELVFRHCVTVGGGDVQLNMRTNVFVTDVHTQRRLQLRVRLQHAQSLLTTVESHHIQV